MLLSSVIGFCIGISILTAYGRVFWAINIFSPLIDLFIGLCLGVVQNILISNLLFYSVKNKQYAFKKNIGLIAGVLMATFFIFCLFNITAQFQGVEKTFNNYINENIFQEYVYPICIVVNIAVMLPLFLLFCKNDKGKEPLDEKVNLISIGLVSELIGLFYFYCIEPILGIGSGPLFKFTLDSFLLLYIPIRMPVVLFCFLIPSICFWIKIASNCQKNKSFKKDWALIIITSFLSSI